jgi:tRNA pseudouridine55 synthase
MNGTLLINKPEGWTSHDVVAKLRGILGTRRIGHAGTLDPFATGLLVVCVGVATRLVQFLIGLDKEYIATVRLGFATDTQDFTGKPITSLMSSKSCVKEEVERVLFEFQGEQEQVPPMFSAKKVGGERLHKAARAGRVVERQAAHITIHSIEMLDDGIITEKADGTRDFRLRVKCSSGTYIRTLAHDIGARLGVGAHLSALHRTAVGHYDIAGALNLDDVIARKTDGSLASSFISLSETVSHLPKLTLDEATVKLIAHGRALILQSEEAKAISQVYESVAQRIVRLCDEAGELVGLGEFVEDQGIVKPRIVLI